MEAVSEIQDRISSKELNLAFNKVEYKKINLSPYKNDPFHRKLLIKTIIPGLNIISKTLPELMYFMGLGISNNDYFIKQKEIDELINNTNHDSTHGVRQILFMEHFFNLLEQHYKELINNRDLLIMKVCVFFRSMGRVHEEKWDIKTNNNVGSAEMFGKFIEGALINGKQITEDEIKYYQALIENTCSTVWKDKIEKGSMTELQWHLMTLVHEIDLFRCWGPMDVIDAMNRNHGEFFKKDEKLYPYNLKNQKMILDMFNIIWDSQREIQYKYDFIPKQKPDLMYMKLKDKLNPDKVYQRIAYLEQQLAAAGRLDGWTINGHQKELQKLEFEL